MSTRVSITKNIFPICINLVLASCLIFSTFSTYLVEGILCENTIPIESNILNLEQGYVHHADFLETLLIAEVSENENLNNKKQNFLSFAKILKTYWLHYTTEKENVESFLYAENPSEKTIEHKYIKYCSLKIPS